MVEIAVTVTARDRLLRLGYRIAYAGLVVVRTLVPYHPRGVKCLITRGDELLLVRHTYGRPVWHVPGGAMRARESPVAAADREMREELGLGGLPWRELPTQAVRLRRNTVTLHCLTADAQDRAVVPRAAEIAGAQWFARDRLPAALGTEDRCVLGEEPEPPRDAGAG